MPCATRIAQALTIAALAVASGCDEEKPKPAPSAETAAAPAPAPAPSSAPTASAAAPAPTASAAAPAHDCPAGSTGDATISKPCDAKGGARMMEVTWTGKTDDKGPFFRVVNKAPSTILYGKIYVYFYDKAGKQLEVKDSGGGKPHPYQTCTGNLFSGVMKAAEKATIQFSCVKKDTVPEGSDKIEAEIQMVGFADATEKKSDWYWRNPDLTPDKRAKGGVK
jgi:hypothetical protein